MDAGRFDALLRSLSAMPSRRAALRALAAAVGATFTSRMDFGITDQAAAKGEHRQRRSEIQSKKSCPPCKKRKKGKCKGLLPDGSACAGGTCQRGTCLADGPAPPSPPCTPTCAAIAACGEDGCGGSCGG